MFYTPDLLRLIATIFIAVTCVVIGDTAGKLLTGGGVDPFIVAWSRFFLAALMLLPFSRLTTRELPALLNRSVLLRAVFIVCGICCILTALKTELERMVVQCAGDRISDCRVIEVLGDHSLCVTNHPKIDDAGQ